MVNINIIIQFYIIITRKYFIFYSLDLVTFVLYAHDRRTGVFDRVNSDFYRGFGFCIVNPLAYICFFVLIYRPKLNRDISRRGW